MYVSSCWINLESRHSFAVLIVLLDSQCVLAVGFAVADLCPVVVDLFESL